MKKHSKNWGGPRSNAGRKLSTVKSLIRDFGQYRVTTDDIKARGGVWNDDYALYIFPDNSTGRFTDIRNGAQEQTRAGENVLHFEECEPLPDEFDS